MTAHQGGISGHLDVSEHTGAVSFYVVSQGDEITGIEILEADPKIKVTPGVMFSILQTGSPWVVYDGTLLRISDGTREVIYRLDGIDTVGGVSYFSWVD